eukprot:5073142-Amphidinium_carterae.2
MQHENVKLPCMLFTPTIPLECVPISSSPSRESLLLFGWGSGAVHVVCDHEGLALLRHLLHARQDNPPRGSTSS